MNTIDYIILGIVGFFLVKGLFKGFIQEVFGLLGLMLAFILATKFMSNAAQWLDSLLDIPPSFSTILGFLVIFFGILIAVQVLSHFLQKIIKYSMLGWLEKLLGGVTGFLKGAIIVSLATIMLAAIPLSTYILPSLENSRLYKPAQRFAPMLFNFLMHVVPDSKNFYGEIKESYDKLPSSKVGKQTKEFLKNMQNDDTDKKQDDSKQ